MMKRLLASLALLAAPLVSHAIEEPAYTVEREWAGVEIRAYAPYVAAEVLVSGPPQTRRLPRRSPSWPATSLATTKASAAWP
jgi:hypothetical protein